MWGRLFVWFRARNQLSGCSWLVPPSLHKLNTKRFKLLQQFNGTPTTFVLLLSYLYRDYIETACLVRELKTAFIKNKVQDLIF